MVEAKYCQLIYVHIHLEAKIFDPQQRCYVKFFCYRFDSYLRIMLSSKAVKQYCKSCEMVVIVTSS